MGRQLAAGLRHPSARRPARVRLRADLAFLGYAELADNVWVSPFPRAELASVLAPPAAARTARRTGRPPDHGAWDLDRACARRTTRGRPTAEAIIERHERAQADPDKAAFAARFHLVHEWRKFLFADPGLPDEDLPDGWPGRTASNAFDATRPRASSPPTAASWPAAWDPR